VKFRPPNRPFPPWRHDRHPDECPPGALGHHHHHHHWQPHHRRGIRHYYGAHLHRRIFFWFGASIFVTWLLFGFLGRVSSSRGILFIVLPPLVLWILSGKIAHRIARPLRELAQVSNEIGNGNLNARATEACLSYDEVGRLARSVNDMAERIQRQLAGQRELLAAVSHELRTPLARMRVLLDIARERGADRETFTEWERELIEMDQLVGELLASARLDFQAVNRAPLDAADVAARALARAGEPKEKLAAPATSVPFSGDPTLLARALANLIDNARKHGRGLRRLEVTAPAGWVSFAVEDGGPGISPDIAARIFEPFVRGERDEPAAGAASPLADTSLGLGLALVARIARAHGGRAFATSLPAGGTRFLLELPVGATSPAA
jgi:two-component system, OmpR family, sensor kinase